MKQSEWQGNASNAGRVKQSSKSKGNGKGKGPRRGRKKAALIWLFFIVLFAIVCAVVGYLLIILNGERILSANMNKLNLDQASVIVDRNNNEVAKLYVAEGNREFVPFGEIPKMVQDAFVATEDKRFYEHGGVDLLGIGRALVKDVIARSAVEGASTITQQLAKNLFLNADKTVFRKGTEASIALALEQKMSKQEILELYLNRIFFGKGQYGVQTAAKFYFNKPLKDLKLWEIATLAGIPKAPSTYNPISNPEKSMERRGVVLSLMLEQGLITQKEKDAAAQVVYNPPASSGQQTKYLTYADYVLDEAQQKTGLSEEELRSAGYKITTTINLKAQSVMEKEFANNDRFEKSVDETKVQGAMVIMDQHDGSLIAMVGGRDYEKQGLNRVTQQRQPGSSFKPIIDYGPAIETGNFFPWSTVQDVKQCFDNGKYCPSNSNGNYLGAIPMRQAIKESRNVSAVWLLNQIGISNGLSFADKLGIKLDKEDRNLSVALGGLTHGVTPLEMVRAYGAFANGGTLQDPHSILSIKDSNGKTVYEYNGPNAKQVMDEKTAYYVTNILQGVVQQGGTGVRANFGSRPIAGKTGTTQAGIPGFKTSGNRDVWFVGYTPEWTAAVWYGYDKTDKNHYLKKSSGQAAAMFAAVMSKALDGVKRLDFPKPAGVLDQQQLKAVTGLTAAYSPGLVADELTWSPVEGEGITYKVYRKVAGEAEFKLLAETADPAYDDLAILPDQTFTYYVTAFQAATKLESPPSYQITVTVTTGMEPSPTPGGDAGGGSPSPDQSGDPGASSEPPIIIEIPGGSPSPSDSPSPTDGTSPSPSPSDSPSP
jgi:penicillin-binding protein 2A